MAKPVKILQASAGSGKTFNLTIQYLILLFNANNKYKEILAVTFTEKATAEMKDRILTVLEGLANGDSATIITNYREIILDKCKTLSAATIQNQANLLYRKILHDYSHFSIRTIDSFVQKVVRSFAFELGLNSDYSIELKTDKVRIELLQRLEKLMDKNPKILNWILQLILEKIEDNESWNYKDQLDNLLKEVFKDSYDDFDQAIQQIGIENTDTVFNDLAKNLSKKMNDFKVEIEKIAQKIDEIKEKHQADCNHFDKKSKNPLFKLNYLTETNHKDFIPRISKFTDLIVSPMDKWFQKNIVLPDFYEDTLPILKYLKHFFEHEYPNYVLNQAVKKNFYYLRLMQELSILLAQYRQETGSLLLRDAQNLINGITTPIDEEGNEIRDENPSFIWEKIGNRFQHFLIDEFQDTSYKQWKNFRALISNAVASSNHQQTEQLLVGDTKQSIYRWRGGDLNILHRQAEIDLGSHQVENDYLKENHRSSTQIIQFNNKLYPEIAQLLQTQLDNEVVTLNETLNEWWLAQYHDYIPSVYNHVAQEKTNRSPEGGIIKVKHFGKTKISDDKKLDEIGAGADDSTGEEDECQPMEQVIEEINWLRSEEMGYPLNEIAILTRDKKDATLAVNALLEAGIPVLSGESLKLTGCNAIKLLIETLKVFVTTNAEGALYKANCMSFYYRLKDKQVPTSAYFSLANKSISDLKDYLPPLLCENWQFWIQLPLVELIEKLYDAYELRKIEKYLPYLFAFRDLISTANSQSEKGIKAFLAWWEIEGIEATLPAPELSNAVQVMTIHKSKGLAFRAVFVPFCNWPVSPKSRSILWVSSTDTDYEALRSIPLQISKSLLNTPFAIQKQYCKALIEEALDSLNLLYVATTRAKDYLFLGLKQNKSTFVGIGASVALALAKSAADFDEKKPLFQEFECVEPIRKAPPTNSDQLIDINEYEYHNRISALYGSPEKAINADALLQPDSAAKRGTLIHQILAFTNNDEEAARYIDNLVMEGTITSSQAQAIIREISGVFAHPALKQLLENVENNYVEKSIITKNGETKRPDRIFFKEDEVIVLDYKFTLEKEKRHILQLTEYKNLLVEMGYPKVKAYLYYGLNNELVLV